MYRLLILALLVGCGRDELRRFYGDSSDPNDPMGPAAPPCPKDFVKRAGFTELPMNQMRSAHTATVLDDGDVLLVGGASSAFSDRFSIREQAFVAGSPINVNRLLHDAVLLRDGRVLIAGGITTDGPTASAEVFDPASEQWTETQPMLRGRWGLRLVLLTDGRVLAVGGWGSGQSLMSSEVYDPVSGSWTVDNDLAEQRGYHSATRLRDGRVLVAGGNLALQTAELWTIGQPGSLVRMQAEHELHAALDMQDGTVWIIGGNSAAVERFNANRRADVWQRQEPMLSRRASHTATRLCSGDIFVFGGGSPGAEIFAVDESRWLAAPAVAERTFHTATTIDDHRVLIAGGIVDSFEVTNVALIYAVP